MPTSRRAESPPRRAPSCSRVLLRGAMAFGALALLAACGAPDAARTSGAQLPNILLVTLDTTRQDVLGVYGRSPSPTPRIDRWAAGAVVFDSAVAEAPVTLPSHASILTALEPGVHGARDNGAFVLRPGFDTLAERLRGEGYDTAAEVAALVLASRHGLDQGFESYGEVSPRSGERPDDHPSRPRWERSATSVTDAALAWLNQQRSAPFFLWVHYFDPHQPYTPPARHARSQGGETYEAEVAYMDEQVGRLLDEVEKLDDRETLIVITADHGESLGEHGEDTHGFLAYDTTLRVPLLFSAPGFSQGGARVSGVVRNIDIAPTILDLVGAEPLEHVQGVSLRAMLSGEFDDLGLQAHSEVMLPAYNFGYAPLHALRYDRWKYIHGEQPELYDVLTDPSERKNLAGENPEELRAMSERLRAHLEDAPLVEHAGDPVTEVDESLAESLRGLGYVGQSAGTPGKLASSLVEELDSTLPSPHQRRAVFRLAAKVEGAIGLQRFDEALRALEQLRRADPALALSDRYEAQIHEGRGAHDAALAALERILDRDPDDASAWTQSARVAWSAGRTEEARARAERARAIAPESSEAWNLEGRALDEQGRFAAAAAAFGRSSELDPRTPWIRFRHALALYRAGRPGESAHSAAMVLELAPRHRRARALRLAALASAGRCDEVRDQLALVDGEASGPSASAALAELRCLVAEGQSHEAKRRGQEAAARHPALAPRVDALLRGEEASLYVDPRTEQATAPLTTP